MRNAHTHNFSLSSRLHFSTVVSSNFEGIVPSFVYETIVEALIDVDSYEIEDGFGMLGTALNGEKAKSPPYYDVSIVFSFLSFFLSFVSSSRVEEQRFLCHRES